MDMMLKRLKLPTDQDRLWLPTLDVASGGQPVVRYRNLSQDKEFRKEVRREMWREEIGAVPLPTGRAVTFQALRRGMPTYFGAAAEGAPVSVSPTTLTATVARVFPFVLDGGILVAQIYFPTPATLASSFQLGIYDATGVVNYTSGTLGTSTGITIINVTDFYLAGGIQRYLGISNANLVSATGAYYFSPPFTAASMPYWGTVAVTNGALGTTITPGSITKTVGGWPVYVCLAAA